MFDIINETKDAPEISALIVQKLANKTNLKQKDMEVKLFSKNQYKAMLKSIQKNLEHFDNKQLIDTFFSIGKLHSNQSQD